MYSYATIEVSTPLLEFTIITQKCKHEDNEKAQPMTNSYPPLSLSYEVIYH